MKVKLTYFKESGKYYTEGEYETKLDHFHDVINEVRGMQSRGELPGLSKGHSQFNTLVQIAGSAPHLVIP